MSLDASLFSFSLKCAVCFSSLNFSTSVLSDATGFVSMSLEAQSSRFLSKARSRSPRRQPIESSLVSQAPSCACNALSVTDDTPLYASTISNPTSFCLIVKDCASSLSPLKSSTFLKSTTDLLPGVCDS